jgi:hypothetical protein
MIIRIQGFDKGKCSESIASQMHCYSSILTLSMIANLTGVFGGNFHTHNMISHIPPGVDVVCYSNGEDYVRGFRNAITQAQNGRVVCFIDSTNLLNLRHLYEKDRGWEYAYPEDEAMMSFHDVRRFGSSGKHLIVTYGNGVVTALRARRQLVQQNLIESEEDVDIVDCPYISDTPGGLREAISTNQYNDGSILFCDICKEGPGSNVLSSSIMGLNNDGILPPKWSFVAAPRTYNPLGNTVTFLNEEDIIQSFVRLNKK